MWVLLALGAAVLTSFNPILYKRMLKDADSTTVVWGVTLLSLPLLGLFTFVLTPQLPNVDWLFGLGILGSAGLNIVAQLASTRALKLADASLITPLLIFSPVFTVLISAIFLREIPSVRGMVGVGLVLVGAYWLNHTAGTGWYTPFQSAAFTPGVTLVLLAGLLWAITPLFEKTAILHTNPESPGFTAFIATFLLMLMLIPAVVARGKPAIAKLAPYRRELFIAGVIAGIAPVLGYTAYSIGLVGYVTTLFKLSTLLTVIWSFLLLKERGLAERLPGSLVMIVGAVLIAY
jgi:drug/metabolite transporter (DMT)-like permease